MDSCPSGRVRLSMQLFACFSSLRWIPAVTLQDVCRLLPRGRRGDATEARNVVRVIRDYGWTPGRMHESVIPAFDPSWGHFSGFFFVLNFARNPSCQIITTSHDECIWTEFPRCVQPGPSCWKWPPRSPLGVFCISQPWRRNEWKEYRTEEFSLQRASAFSSCTHTDCLSSWGEGGGGDGSRPCLGKLHHHGAEDEVMCCQICSWRTGMPLRVLTPCGRGDVMGSWCMLLWGRNYTDPDFPSEPRKQTSLCLFRFGHSTP